MAKENNEDNFGLIGKKIGHLSVVGLAPRDKYPSKNHGRYWECFCDCGNTIYVPTSYLLGHAGRGDYRVESCGCYRLIRHYMSFSDWGVEEEFLLQFRQDWPKFTFLSSSLLKHQPRANLKKEYIEKELVYFYYQEQFNAVYYFWKNYEKYEQKTFYNFAKPSIDHIIPKSKGGDNDYLNLQFLTVFENLSKRDMNWEEWTEFKEKTNSHSDLYIENVLLWYREYEKGRESFANTTV